MKIETFATYTGPHLELIAASESAVRAIPPLWPLASSVAVNPFLGQSGNTLAETSARLRRVAGIAATMPRAHYKTKIARGEMTEDDLAAALEAAPAARRPANVAALIAALDVPAAHHDALPTVADLAAEASNIDWPGLIAERIGAWAASHFDQGQALWQIDHTRPAYTSWRRFAARDLTPEIIGLRGFAAHVAQAPGSARQALAKGANAMGVSGADAQTYFHQLLLGLGGWSQMARYRLWQAELAGETDDTTSDLLTIRLIWEEALLAQYQDQIGARWQETRSRHGDAVAPDDEVYIDVILQDAAERAAQRGLAAVLSAPAAGGAKAARPALQAAFCIDVRSEVFRRALEGIAPQVQTLGFAGFFGLATAHADFASDVVEHRLPVLLNPAMGSRAGDARDRAADSDARIAARAARAWGRFKLAAVSSFAFVEATGPIYVGKLLRDALGLKYRTAGAAPAPRFHPALDAATSAAAAANILRGMSLTRDFAPLVLLLGHGASTVNNPHASALQCGACGGYSGEVNARLLARLLNDPVVRKWLRQDGIDIPGDTLFLGGLHDTVTDDVKIYAGDHDLSSHRTSLGRAEGWMKDAGRIARTERAARLPHAADGAALPKRSRDWAEIRPEWALAGCSAFVAAPRSRTRGRDLQGCAFLHDYDWTRDEGFAALELILTAPVVVASWISLQYYGSAVAPDVFGAGNKLLHNVTGGIGVVEGNGGTLRGGLPWQSVHDGTALAHDPLRLSVCIEAPRDAICDVLSRHDGVRELFDNGWLHLFALDDRGHMAARYAGGLTWQDQVAPAA